MKYTIAQYLKYIIYYIFIILHAVKFIGNHVAKICSKYRNISLYHYIKTIINFHLNDFGMTFD